MTRQSLEALLVGPVHPRHQFVEAKLTQTGRRPEQASLEEREALWRQVKLDERVKTDAQAPRLPADSGDPAVDS